MRIYKANKVVVCVCVSLFPSFLVPSLSKYIDTKEEKEEKKEKKHTHMHMHIHTTLQSLLGL